MFYDNLSGLPNAILFIDRLQQAVAHAIRRQQKLALIYLEVDGYQQVIEEQGFSGGDRVIMEVAERLTHCVRRQDDTVGRICGDQFGVILGNVDGPAGVRKVMGNIASAMQECVSCGSHDRVVTLSVGASLYPHDGKEWSGLLRSAAVEMHLAKQAGGNSYFFSGADVKSECIMAADKPATTIERPLMSRKSWERSDTQLLNLMGLSA